jgi:Zn-dependent protease
MQKYSNRITFSSQELKDLFKSLLVIGLAYTIVTSGFSLGVEFFVMLIISIATAGAAFLFHELSHKIAAHRYGCQSEFRSDNTMLFFTLVLSFLGMMFAAPGAVYISGTLTTREYGKVSAAGPLSNIIMAILFLGLTLFFPGGFLQAIGLIGMSINAWIALFNMIPFGNFDGIKIWRWSKVAYFALVLASAAITMGARYIVAPV